MIFEEINLNGQYDYLVYAGKIERGGYQQLTNLLETKKNQEIKSAYLVLVTTGGDADAAFRIARALGHYYPRDLRLFIPDICKSAGTLIAIGAKELIISDRGELGPLDVQFAKKDELFEMSSGLDVVKSIHVLQDEVKFAFREYLLDLRLGGGIGTKMAAQLASEMASRLISPITSQIDPLRLGEHQRALLVATAYGRRLSGKFTNITDDKIDRLVLGYPSHSFVIDRKEASELFKRVRAPNSDEDMLELALRDNTVVFHDPSCDPPKVFCLNDAIQELKQSKGVKPDSSEAAHAKHEDSAKQAAEPTN